ncbi:MAG: hypothetical protein ACREHV_12805, partial [Rhizomicrobium sp.]
MRVGSLGEMTTSGSSSSTNLIKSDVVTFLTPDSVMTEEQTSFSSTLTLSLLLFLDDGHPVSDRMEFGSNPSHRGNPCMFDMVRKLGLQTFS